MCVCQFAEGGKSAFTRAVAFHIRSPKAKLKQTGSLDFDQRLRESAGVRESWAKRESRSLEHSLYSTLQDSLPVFVEHQ